MKSFAKKYYLDICDIQLWQSKISENKTEQLVNADINNKLSEVNSTITHPDNRSKVIAELKWDELEFAVNNCTACPLHSTRTKPVFGVGSKTADLIIIGEAPGANEDQQGEPFVGRAGQLLNAMLQAIGLKREQIYIANILKSRPPNNRDPKPEEVAACTPFLLRQLVLLQPKLILAVGRIAAHYLLSTNTAMANLRGQEFAYGDNAVPLLVTYHPAYLLRSPREKAKAWQDLQLVAKKLKTLKNR